MNKALKSIGAALTFFCGSLVGFVPAPAQPSATIQEYILGPGDVVEVKVLGREDFNTRTRVREDGAILLPLIGEVAATGQSPIGLSELVGNRLRSEGYFPNPVVSVDVVSYASRYVTVLGSVSQPGLVPVDRAYKLSEILARVGGVREGSADYIIVRPENGPEARYAIETLAIGDSAQDPVVSPGDKLYVPEAEVFYIYGQVNSPGEYPLMSEPNLRKALALGGGLSLAGTHKRIRIVRDGKVMNVSDLRTEIRPDDIIFVRERLF
ncbi:polysaccharide biosynthesis/export family protein [Sphingosinicella humi]|uniref:Capsular biosynthesis protein n=1 Tax=Allosphingosinicella humi TaxID=2068657 RepID=A0A2U2J532_9SPHN|nr:polysaccharide biosynthesis/export family protein [Sphingosinicella humi]PWG03437.1 capsular biosynthesis protein [Sphingosinicella humi]